MAVFDGLEPKNVLEYFEQICAIPHPSGHPQKIGDHIAAFAKTHALRCLRDGAGNVIVFKDGDRAKEPVILQAHLDMVCVREDGVQIDFLRDGLPVYTDGACIRSRGTSLGADDGIGAAMILAVLAANLPGLPPIEAVFTADEEVGMLGAAALDASVLRSRRMINLDSENENEILVSCAGGERVTITRGTESARCGTPCFCARLSGFAGGHSGTEIGTGRLNAVVCTAKALLQTPGVRLCALEGGEVDNAIPDACTAVCCGDSKAFLEVWHKYEKGIRSAEPDAAMDVTKTSAEKALTADCSHSVLSLICTLPNGVQKRSAEIENFVETSLNLGRCRVGTNAAELHYSVRSSVDSEKDALAASMHETARQYGASFETSGMYPAWQYRKDSPLRDAAVAAYEKVLDRTPHVLAIHAGLECGLFCGKIPGLDCISIGPDIENIHSPGECLDTRSAARIFASLLEILRRL